MTTGTTRPIAMARRTLLRGSVLGGGLAVTSFAGACATRSSEEPTPATSSRPSPPPAAAPSNSPSNSRPAPSVLIAYFSRPGENYYYGGRRNLRVGNTEVLAGILRSRLRCDVHRIEAADPYSDDYDDTVARNVREQDDDARPGIANPIRSIDGYDVILLGSPIWNVRPPMIMRSFADRYDFSGKAVHPFVTYAVSGLGTAERDYAAFCRGATIGESLAVQGETVADAGPDVTAWLSRVNLP